MRRPWLFGSFFLAGFECSTHLMAEGHRLDLIAATQHDVQARDDYALCRAVGIRAVREAARWPIVDRGGRLDLDSVRRLVRLGREAELTQLWDLMHYGYPDDLDPFSSEFVDRFAAFAEAVATVVCEDGRCPTYWTPVNEISYHAWAGGEVAYMAPYGRGRGSEYKRALVRAAIAATNAIWEVDPDAKMLSVDPLIRLHVPTARPDLESQADHFNHHVVNEAWDLLAGRFEPELGGSRPHLGLVGVNYYWCNQWTIPTPEQPQRFVGWDEPEYIPMSDLLLGLQARYGGPLLIAETSGTADRRPGWISYLAREAKATLDRGVDLQGICLYPIVTSPDWEDTTAFFDGGLFDISVQPDGSLKRVLYRPAARALREAQAALDPENEPIEPLDREPPAPASSAPEVARPLEQTHFKPDNFSYQTLLAGDSLVVELYCFEPGFSLGDHRHESTEHVLTIMAGQAKLRIGEHCLMLQERETILVPAGSYHSIENVSSDRLVVQQVSAPKPWDSRFGGPHPTQTG
jgi:quercetin dioxygenase-like cupin family protein